MKAFWTKAQNQFDDIQADNDKMANILLQKLFKEPKRQPVIFATKFITVKKSTSSAFSSHRF